MNPRPRQRVLGDRYQMVAALERARRIRTLDRCRCRRDTVARQVPSGAFLGRRTGPRSTERCGTRRSACCIGSRARPERRRHFCCCATPATTSTSERSPWSSGPQARPPFGCRTRSSTSGAVPLTAMMAGVGAAMATVRSDLSTEVRAWRRHECPRPSTRTTPTPVPPRRQRMRTDKRRSSIEAVAAYWMPSQRR